MSLETDLKKAAQVLEREVQKFAPLQDAAKALSEFAAISEQVKRIEERLKDVTKLEADERKKAARAAAGLVDNAKVEAKEEAERILDNAQSEATEIIAEATGKLSEAEAKGNKVIERAHAEAQRIKDVAAKSVEAAKDEAEKLKAQIRSAKAELEELQTQTKAAKDAWVSLQKVIKGERVQANATSA